MTTEPLLAGLPIDHIGIAVSDLEAASEPYRLLGLKPLYDEVITHQQVKVRSFQAGGSLIELLAPTAKDSPIARFIDKRGPGLHHVAFRVTNSAAELKRLKASGAELIDTVPRAGRAGTQVAFLHPRWAGGVLIELVEHP
jgi:methylmalonyl-CoA/ethylmalonyl-CoA epimerase